MSLETSGHAKQASRFGVLDPVHGMVHLPGILQRFIDHRFFQRLRHVKQLGVCSHVYPGATHNRFIHSIGTAHLTHQMVKSIRERQPELDITDQDMLCLTIAALLHDLGHPCFSHMFEHFVHRVARTKAGLSDEQRCRYEAWNHEQASVHLIRHLWADLESELKPLGLEAEDLDFVCSLVDPPKKQLIDAMKNGSLGDVLPRLLPRDKKKSWMYEIVSNWRSGLDTDRFDYFRRDAFYLGLHRQFDHQRYMSTVRVLFDRENQVWTLSPPDKDKDLIRDDFLDLRRSLHRTGYQHKTVQKLEQHMIDVLQMLDGAGLSVLGSAGREFGMCEAAVDFDAEAYVQLIDPLIESLVFQVPRPASPFHAAYKEFEYRVIKRNLLRLLADFDVPADMDFKPIGAAAIIKGTLQTYRAMKTDAADISEDKFRANIAEFHQGMGRQDPLQRVLFHSSKDPERQAILHASEEVPPLTQKVFLFFDGGPRAHETQQMRDLVDAFKQWLEEQSGSEAFRSPVRPRSRLSEVKLARVLHSNNSNPPDPPKKRQFAVRSSCPDSPSLAPRPEKKRRQLARTSSIH